MSAPRRWSSGEDTRLREMQASGFSEQYICLALNRTLHSIKERSRWINQTEEQRQRRRNRINALRYKRDSQVGTLRTNIVRNATVIDKTILLDRERRMLAPRTLTGMILGDPPQGYSALDRKRAEVRA